MRFMNRAKDFVVLVALSLLLTYVVVAGSTDPIGPEKITKVGSERIDEWDGVRVDAEAGNVTELAINASGVTQHWAGFFGNVTGVITLDDANNNTMYDWTVAEPQGQIYASTHSPPTWANIDCLNHTSGFSLTEVEANLSMEPNDEDGVNETFCPGCNSTYKSPGGVYPPVNHSEFWVGYKEFEPRDCWAIATYVSDSAQSGADPDFVEVLLQDGTDAVYMTIIEDKDTNTKASVTGFDGNKWDFQMLVGENGNGSNALTTTPYYFYVELV